MSNLDPFLQINIEVMHFLLSVSYTFQIPFTSGFFHYMSAIADFCFAMMHYAGNMMQW